MKKIKISLIIVIMFLFVININKVKAVEELPDDGGRISSSQVIQTKTGTGPFDENDEPGNDSSEDNNIVRSFDQVTWTIENTMVLNGNEADSYSGGRIYFEAVLPEPAPSLITLRFFKSCNSIVKYESPDTSSPALLSVTIQFCNS